MYKLTKAQKKLNEEILKDLKTDKAFYLQSEMLSKDIGLRDLSKITGINETNLSKYVNAKLKMSLKIALKISAALDCGVENLIELSAIEVRELEEIKKRAAKFAA